ncbi:MAG TPA: hypothetical protein ENF41_04405 [Candidatus Bathyarchaeota archaeon]|nr:hypothetical protein [Candidatus Bathyarchaeota archaeon]
MSTPILENIRRIREDIMERIRSFRPGTLLSQTAGGGRIIDNIRERVETLRVRVEEMRPNIIPKVVESIKTWEPGKLVEAAVPRISETSPPAPKPSGTVKTVRGGYKLHQ